VIISFNARPVFSNIYNVLVKGKEVEKFLAIKTLFFYNETVSPAYELTYLMEAYCGCSGIALIVSYE